MRLTARNRNSRRAKVPRISISQEEITADLIYPAHRRSAPSAGAGRVRGRR
jgi:hypothetical protein